MTASLHKLGSGSTAGLYYTNDPMREARPRSRDEYYSRDGGGIWWSSGESVVRHGAPVHARSFRDLCAGLYPATGQPLVRGAGEGHWAGVDLTLSAGKSVSVLWMSGSPEQRQRIEAAHDAAVDRALRFVADEDLVLVRHGRGGINRAKPTDLMVATFGHFTTREGDPNLHTHAVHLNVAGSPLRSGRYITTHLTIEPEKLFRWKLAVGAAYRAALAEELAPTGFSFRPAGRGQWEIAGVPESVLEAFSKRSQQIEAYAGSGATAAQKEIAALATRQAKEDVPTGEELEARWRTELKATGVDPWAAALGREAEPTHLRELKEEQVHDLFVDPPELPSTSPVALAASALFRHESVIDRRRLLEGSLVEAALRGQGPEAVYAELAQLEDDGRLVRLDGGHWTTPAVAAVEAAMLRAAARAQEREWFAPDAVEAALAAAPYLSDEQRAAVLYAARSDGVGVIEAGAGTGKTTLAKAVVDAAQRSGLTVIGLAPSWVAADEVAQSAGVAAQAIARWRWDQAQGRGTVLSASTLVLVDEAGMVGTRDMEAVLTAAHRTGAKVLILGDTRQLESVPGASALKGVREVVQQGAVMEAVRRQLVDWQKGASVLMARGEAETGLRAYAAHDRVELVSGEEAARNKVIEHWREARSQHGDDVLIITRRNVDAEGLNRAARDVLKAEGRIDAVDVVLPAIGRDDKRGMIALVPGDRIRFSETLSHLGVRNGNRAVVEALEGGGGAEVSLRLRLEDERTIETAWTDLVPEWRKGAVPRVVHAYAGTAHAAQGRTAEAAVLYIARQTDAREIYVGLTRHRQDVRVVVERGRLEAGCRLRQADHRIAPTEVAIRERLFSEARQYREKANVVDFVEDRSAFVTSGQLEIRRPEHGWRISRVLQAAQALRKALNWLHPHKMVLTGLGLKGENRSRIRTLSNVVAGESPPKSSKVKNARQREQARGLER